MVAHLTPDQAVGRSSRSGLIFCTKYLKLVVCFFGNFFFFFFVDGDDDKVIEL